MTDRHAGFRTAALSTGAAIVVLSFAMVGGCKKGGDSSSSSAGTEKQQPQEQQPKAGEQPAQTAASPKPAPPSQPEELAGSHILIAYKGAMRARPNVKRSKKEAKKLAEKLVKQATESPDKFADLARKHSDGPSKVKGGDLGAWRKGQMVPAFDRAIEKLKVGEVAAAPVETPFGFHVMKRNPLPPKLAGAHILIAYKGAMRARPDVTRSKKEARKLAAKLSKQLKKSPDKFAEVARKQSDGPSKVKGGDLGTWRRGRMVPAFDEAIGKLKIGEVSGVVETPFGFHVMKRLEPKG